MHIEAEFTEYPEKQDTHSVASGPEQSKHDKWQLGCRQLFPSKMYSLPYSSGQDVHLLGIS
jgi:hypothetical protein